MEMGSARTRSLLSASTLLCVGTLILQCAGTFTSVPVQHFSNKEIRSIDRSVHPMSVSGAQKIMDRNYYTLLYRYGLGGPGESQQQFVRRSLRQQQISPAVLSRVTHRDIQDVRESHSPERASALEQAAVKVQSVVNTQLQTVGKRVSRAADLIDVEFRLEPGAGLNAFVPAGFQSRQVYVGPQLVLLSSSDGELAQVLGHELAHIALGHTKSSSAQAFVVGTLQFTAAVAVIAFDIANRRAGGIPLPSNSPAIAATIVGGVANGAIKASGFPRDLEREADYYGLVYMKKSGFRGEQAAVFYRNLLSIQKGTGRQFELPFLRTHPVTAERVALVGSWLSQSKSDPNWPAVDATEKDQREQTRRKNSKGQVAVADHEATQTRMSSAPTSCWESRGTEGDLCTTCYQDGRWSTTCIADKAHNESTPEPPRPRPLICWNVDAFEDGDAAICTTCCSASVTCSTTCS